MRYCLYCGMPMEDDDMFCTRCGKAAAENGEKAASNEEVRSGALTKDAAVTGTTRTVTDETASGAGADAASGVPCKDSPDSGMRLRRNIMITAAAVLVSVSGLMLFLLLKPANSSGGAENKDTAVYENDSREEEKLNRGQQTPSRGQAPDDSPDDRNQGGPSQVRTDEDTVSGQQADTSAADSGSRDGGSAASQDRGSAASQDRGSAASQGDGQSTETGDASSKDDEDDDSGWEVDEDGNEVYYAGKDEENTDNNQTGTNDQTGTGGDIKSDSGSVTIESASEGRSISDEVLSGYSDYILPDSSTQYYTREELSRLDDDTLQMAINELYARHGRRFETDSIREYFEGKSWYDGTIDPLDFDGRESEYFNACEQANHELMSQIRSERQGMTGQ